MKVYSSIFLTFCQDLAKKRSALQNCTRRIKEHCSGHVGLGLVEKSLLLRSGFLRGYVLIRVVGGRGYVLVLVVDDLDVVVLGCVLSTGRVGGEQTFQYEPTADDQ